MKKKFGVLGVAFALVGFTLMMGCGSGQGPLSSDQGPAISEGDQVSTQVLPAAKRAVKKSKKLRRKTRMARMSKRGGALHVKLRKYGSKNDVIVKDAWFRVAPNSIVGGGKHNITMKVYSGTTVGDVDVVFGPSGLKFDPSAELTLRLRGPITPADVREALHIHGDGIYVEKIDVETDKRGNSFLRVLLRVPGFSRYSLGIGDR